MTVVPVPGPVQVRGFQLAADEQADPRAHGGADKAVHAYAQEDYDCWRDHEGIDTQPRIPCYKLGMRMRDALFPKRFQPASRPGAYLGTG